MRGVIGTISLPRALGCNSRGRSEPAYMGKGGRLHHNAHDSASMHLGDNSFVEFLETTIESYESDSAEAQYRCSLKELGNIEVDLRVICIAFSLSVFHDHTSRVQNLV